MSESRLPEDLYDQYLKRLCRLAARMIGERLRGRYAPEDAAQSALASFFRGETEGRYDVDDSGKLWALLVTIMRHKIQKRGGRAKEDRLVMEIIDSEPSHEAAVELADGIEAVLKGMKERDREICRLFYQEGLSVSEIAQHIGCSRWTVRRVLNRFGRGLDDDCSPSLVPVSPKPNHPSRQERCHPEK